MAVGNGGGGGGKSGDVRAGGAFVEISAKDSLTKALAVINIRVKKFADGLRSVGGKVAVAGSAALAPIIAIAKSGIDRAEGIGRMAKQLNVTVEMMQRLQYAAEVTGNSIDDIMKNPQRFSELMKDAPILDVGEIKAATSINQEFRKSWVAVQNAILPLATSLAPVVADLGKFVRENAGLVQVAALACVGVIGLGAALWATGAAVGGLVTIVGALVSPFAIVTAAIAGASYALSKYTDAGRNARADVKQTFGAMFEAATESFGGIVSAISKGRFDLVLKVATAGALLVWEEFCSMMSKKWGETKSDIVGSFRDMKYILGNYGVDFASWLGKSGLAHLPVTNRQIDIGANAAKNDLSKQLDRDRDAAKIESDKKLAEARANVEKAKQELAASLKEVAAAPQKPKGAMKSEDYMYFAGIASRGAFRITGDQRQFSEGAKAQIAQRQLKLSEILNANTKAMADELKNLNRNLRLT